MAADQDLTTPGAAGGVVHVVAVSHLDTQWRWTIRDTICRHLPKTLRENFAAFRAFPHYVVQLRRRLPLPPGAGVLPARVRRAAALGGRRPLGAGGLDVDAADVNIPSPESLVRQILYGRLWFRRELGVEVRDLFLPDCFGFGWAWPSIAAHCGASGFSTQKLSKGLGAIAIPFPLGVWQGPDGAELVSALKPGDYVEPLTVDPARDPEALAQLERNGAVAGVRRALRYFGIGDTGGAPDRRSLRRLEQSVAARRPVRVETGPAGELFDALDEQEIARLPRYRGELLLSLHATGCYTSQAAMKRWNRKNEQLADAAERAAVTADWLGAQPYPRARLREAWQRFLWHQFHDDLTGTSIPAAYRYSWNDELLSLGQFAETLRASVGAVARGLDTRVDGLAVVVFNPLSIERRDLVELRLPLAGGIGEQRVGRVLGPRGEEEPVQIEPLGDGTARVLFTARLAPLGFAVFDLQLGREPAGSADLAVDEGRLENRRLRAGLDARGDVASLVDRGLGREMLRGPASWELLADRSLRFPAWEIRFEDIAAEPLARLGQGARLRIVERGPVRVTIEVRRELAGSTFVTAYRLCAQGEALEVDCEIDWRTRGRLLKASFPAALAADAVATYDLGLGTIERPVNQPRLYEVPAQQWADLSSPADSAGLAIFERQPLRLGSSAGGDAAPDAAAHAAGRPAFPSPGPPGPGPPPRALCPGAARRGLAARRRRLARGAAQPAAPRLPRAPARRRARPRAVVVAQLVAPGRAARREAGGGVRRGRGAPAGARRGGSADAPRGRRGDRRGAPGRRRGGPARAVAGSDPRRGRARGDARWFCAARFRVAPRTAAREARAAALPAARLAFRPRRHEPRRRSPRRRF